MKQTIDFSWLEGFENSEIASAESIKRGVQDSMHLIDSDISISFVSTGNVRCGIEVIGWADTHFLYNEKTGKQVEKQLTPYFMVITAVMGAWRKQLYQWQAKDAMNQEGYVRRHRNTDNLS